MARMTKKEKNRLFWERVEHVRANPLDIAPDEVRDYSFLCALINIPKYGPDPDVMWKRGERNGRYSVQHHAYHQGHSRSGKTHYWYNWFDVLDHDTGSTFQVSHFLGSSGKSLRRGYNKNIFEAERTLSNGR
jgi:hypothetical protein